MRLSTYLVAGLASVAAAAPHFPVFDIKNMHQPGAAVEALSNYFNLIAYKAQAAKAVGRPPVCDVSSAQMPVAPIPMTAPSKGLKPHHIAVGRGTQNYTCASSDSKAAPEAAGAVATLFNVSCLAATSPELVTRVADMAIHFSRGEAERHALGPAPWPVSGKHYFSAPGVAYFDLDTGGRKYGQAPCQKDESSAAPAEAARGPEGEKAVAWLRLKTIKGATDEIEEIYRVNTVGGSPPATCEGMPETFEVEYSAVYWFFSGKIQKDDA